jgi:hypothetical protein
LWTPGYWGFVGGVYRFHVGYWGPHVGYYGGVNYGFGYVGVGFAGGRWVGNSFAYNRAVVNVNVNIHNTYNETVVNRVSVTRVSYNGGPGGTSAVPSAQERRWASERHFAPTGSQHQHAQEAFRNPALSARNNGGHPGIAATPRPGAFNGPGVVGAHGANMSPGAAQRGGQPAQYGQQNGAQRAGQPGQYGQQNGAQRGGQAGQYGQPNGAQRGGQPGQPGQPNHFVRTPGQPTGAARTQGQPAQPPGGKAPAKGNPRPEKQRGEKEK